MPDSTPHVQQIRVESKTLPVRDRVEQTSARGDITVSPCGGINIALSLDRPNETITISAEDLRDDNASFVYKKEGGTYDSTQTYGPFPEGEEVFYIKEKNKSCIFKVTKEVIHCDISISGTVTDETYNDSTGEIEVTVTTPSDSVEWRFDGGAWFSASKTYTWTGLDDGTYLVEARDEYGCTASAMFTVENEADTFAPSIPQNITIQDAADGESALLDWDDSVDDETSVDYYNVYRSTTQGFTIDSNNRIGQPSSSDFEDTGVVDGTTYYYKITAVDIRGNESSPSTEKQFTFTDDVAPQAPSNLSGQTSDNTVSLDWDASSSPDVDHYNVYQDSVKVTESTDTTEDITGLVNGQDYDFFITAVDEADNESPASNIINKTPQDTTPPSAPTNLSSSFDSNNVEVNLTWDDNTEDDFEDYNVYRSTSQGGSYNKIASGIANSQYTDSTINTGTTYYYVVTATDDDDLESGFSNEVSVSTLVSENYTYDEPEDLQNNNWTNRVFESNFIKDNNGVLEADGLNVTDGFEDNTRQEWIFDNPSMSIRSDIARGSYSIGMEVANPGQVDQAHKDYVSSGIKADYVQFYYNEKSSSNGIAVRVLDSSGNPVIAAATNNPQWDIESSSGWSQYYDGDGLYDDWHRVKIIFDWSAGTADVEWENLDSGVSKTFTGINLINSTDVASLYVKGYNNLAYSDNNDFYGVLDDFEVSGNVVNEAYRIPEPIALENINDVNSSLAEFVDNSSGGSSVDISTKIGRNDETYEEYSVNFDGFEDHVTVGSTSYHISGSDDFSLSAWVKWDGSTDTIQGIFQSLNPSDVTGASNAPYGLFLRPTGEPRLLLQNASNSGISFTVSESAPVDTWQHIVAVKNGTTIKIYVDGVEKLSSTFSDDILDFPEDIDIGVWKKSDDRYFSGNLSRVKLYSKGLSSSEVNSLYQGNEINDSLLSDWKMNDGSGSVTDYAGGFDGSLVGDAFWELDSPSAFLFESQSNGAAINGISAGDDLKDKYLWIQQTLLSDGTNVPKLDSFHAEVDNSPTSYIPVPQLRIESDTANSVTLEIGGIWYSPDEYRIYRSSSKGGSYSLLDTISNPDPLETYQDTGLSQDYFYVATTVENSTESSYSDEVKFANIALDDGFEDNDLSEWTNIASYFEIKTDQVYNGSYSAGADKDSVTEYAQADYVLPSAKQISKLSFYYWETSNGTGNGIKLLNSNGNLEQGVGTNNPEWIFISGNNDTDINEVYDGDGLYQNWHRVELEFDWDANTISWKWKNLTSGIEKSGSNISLNHGVDIERIRINAVKGFSGESWAQSGTPNQDVRYDDILIR